MATSESNFPVGSYGPLTVLKSAAGYYVGTLYREDFGLVPGSRDSEYFATAEAAQSYLDYITKTWED